MHSALFCCVKALIVPHNTADDDAAVKVDLLTHSPSYTVAGSSDLLVPIVVQL